MEHLALYRKFRPQTFNEVIGQDHIIKTLIGQIQNNQISHAYLFCGTRGTGKTSTAKIFAKAINCKASVNGSPCGECDVCSSLGNASNIDVMEIDAASNNRVDEIRDLREKVKYPPIVAKYKVYIIDEVHMLSDSAFNALLKTLEEPPSHVVFILATTDVQKVPATILSRCMRMDFKLVSIEDLEKQLQNIFNASKINCTKEALHLIAKSAEGSVRDALSIAEMCSAYTCGNIDYDNAMKCLGASSQEVLFDIASSILNQNVEKLFEVIEREDKEGKNFAVLGKDISTYFKDLILIKNVKNAQNILKLPDDIFNNMKELSSKFDTGRLLSCMNNVSTIEAELKYAINPKLLVENICLSSLLTNNISILELSEKISKLEKAMQFNTVQIIPQEHKEQVLQTNREEKQENQIQEQKVEEDTINNNQELQNEQNEHLEAVKIWGNIVSELRNSNYNMLFAVAEKVVKVEIENDYFIITTTTEGSKKMLELSDNIKILSDIIKQKINENYKIKVVFNELMDKNKQILDFLLSKFDNDIKIK